MPRYEYRCRSCGETFDATRPMAEASSPATCPIGHDDTVKLLTTFSVGNRTGTGAPAGGGCCGGACAAGEGRPKIGTAPEPYRTHGTRR